MFNDRRLGRLKHPGRLFLVMPDSFLVRLDRRMHVVVGEVKQEWPLLITAPQELDRLLGQPFGQVLPFRFRRQSRVGPGRVITARW